MLKFQIVSSSFQKLSFGTPSLCLFQQLLQFICRFRPVFPQHLDKLAANDGAVGMGKSRLEGIAIADAKADKAGIAEVHGLDAPEICLLVLVEGPLRTGSRRAGYHVDKAARVSIDFTDAFLGCLRGDEHNHPQVVSVGHGFVFREIFGEGEVGDNDAVDAGLATTFAEMLEAILHDRIEVAHQDDRDVNLRTHLFQLAEEEAEAHAVAQGLCRSLLDDRTVCHRVGKRNTDFNHVDASLLERLEDGQRVV